MKNVIVMMCLLMSVVAGWAQEAEQQDADVKYAGSLVAVGCEAPDFALKSPEGTRTVLSEVAKGHWTVIDFWASWCPDCRKDIPSVKKMYEAYAQKGVRFVGVSFDYQAEAWEAAIKKYDMGWTHVSELKKMRESAVAQAYGVKWIPSMVLVDPDGRVALSTVMVEKMERKLKEVIR